MQSTLVVDGRGAMMLPAKLRKALGLQAEGRLIAVTTPDGVLLRRAELSTSVEMYSDRRLGEFAAEEARLAHTFSKALAR